MDGTVVDGTVVDGTVVDGTVVDGTAAADSPAIGLSRTSRAGPAAAWITDRIHQDPRSTPLAARTITP
jgi:hypothetical protein